MGDKLSGTVWADIIPLEQTSGFPDINTLKTMDRKYASRQRIQGVEGIIDKAKDMYKGEAMDRVLNVCSSHPVFKGVDMLVHSEIENEVNEIGLEEPPPCGSNRLESANTFQRYYSVDSDGFNNIHETILGEMARKQQDRSIERMRRDHRNNTSIRITGEQYQRVVSLGKKVPEIKDNIVRIEKNREYFIKYSPFFKLEANDKRKIKATFI